MRCHADKTVGQKGAPKVFVCPATTVAAEFHRRERVVAEKTSSIMITTRPLASEMRNAQAMTESSNVFSNGLRLSFFSDILLQRKKSYLSSSLH